MLAGLFIAMTTVSDSANGLLETINEHIDRRFDAVQDKKTLSA